MPQPLPDDDDVAPAVPLWKRRPVQFIACGVIAVVVFAFVRGTPPPKDDDSGPAKKSASFIGDVVPYQAPKPVEEEPAPSPPTMGSLLPGMPPATAAAFHFVPPTLPNASIETGGQQPPPPAPAQKPDRPAMVSYAVPHMTASAPSVGAGTAAPAETHLDFKATALPGVKASPAMDETLMLAPGLLPCVLDTAISSDVPAGPLMCHLPGPIYSRAGVLLMEAGTQVIGKYVGMNNGQNRLEAVSTFAHTPNGVWVPLTGPMADDLGRSGLPGNVDHRYLERFGGAVILTLTQSALSIVQALVSKGGNTYVSLNAGGDVGSLAQDILREQINLKPIFSKNQGEMIALWITEPVSFADSYRLRVRQ